MKDEVWLTGERIQPLIDRVLSLRCSDATSREYGSFDRDYWSYRTIRGFQSAPFQHVMSGFAYLQNQLLVTENQYREIAESALSQWIAQCNGNGSANEWYRNEQSFCATAMGLHAATETALILMENSGVSLPEYRLTALARSERWLRNRSNPIAANQEIASAVGRWNLGLLLADSLMQDAATDSLRKSAQELERRGYLSEYGGFDIGYSLLSLELLISPHQAGCEVVLPIADRICELLNGVISGGGEFPFALGSRGTHHPFYAGVHYFSIFSSEAERLHINLKSDHLIDQVGCVSSYDDRYLATFGFSSIARLIAHQQVKKSNSPSKKSNFRTSPLERIEVSGGTLFCNRSLGSGIQYLSDNHETFVHLGYSATVDGQRWCSLTAPTGDSVPPRHHLVRQSTRLPLQRFQFLFSLLQSICRIPWVASQVSLFARTELGRPSRFRSAYFIRTLEILDETLMVRDEIHSGSKSQLLSIQSLSAFPFHSPSRFATNLLNSGACAELQHEELTVSSSKVIRWRLDTSASPLRTSLSES